MTTESKELKGVADSLAELQKSGAVMLSDLRRTHRGLHEHLSSIYLWWREARLIDGYLDAEYDKLGRTFKTIKYGTNYRPLLFLVYGEGGGLDKNNLPNYNATLNALHAEYEKRPKLYEQDSATKLTTFISNAGGVVELAKTVPADDDDSKFPALDRKQQAAFAAQIRKILLNEAVACSLGSPLPMLPIPHYITLGYKKHSVLLVNQTERGVGWFSTSTNQGLIQELLVAEVKHRFDLQHPRVRPLLELLQTQSLPKHLAGLSSELVDKTTLPDYGNQKFIAERRAIYLHESGEFVLSPMNAEAGVVSIVRPSAAMLPKPIQGPMFENCKHDLLIQPSVRAEIEANMLHDFEFNHYDAAPLRCIPVYSKPNSASHVLSFRHRANKQRRFHVPFWPCYDSFEKPQFQLIKNPSYQPKVLWKSTASAFWFQNLTDAFLDNWLHGQAKHLKRKDRHYKIRVLFGENALCFEFVYRSGEYENFELVPLENTADGASACVATFASTDLVPVLRSVAHLQTSSAISIKLSPEMLRLKFTTVDPGGSEHEILVPTLNGSDEKAKAPFMLYQPTVVASNEQ